MRGTILPGGDDENAANLTKSGPPEERKRQAADPNFMMSLARGLIVIQALNQQRRALSASQISQRTGIPRAAVRRCLLTLMHLGFVASEGERCYALRPRVLSLGSAYLASSPLGKVAQPILSNVRNRLQETACISVLDGDQILCIARSPAKRLMTTSLDAGSRLPASCTSIGRVLISQFKDEAIDSYLDSVKLVAHTSKTIVDVAALRAELIEIRQEGFCIVDEELEIGLRSLAVPVIDEAGAAIAGLSVGVHTARVSVADLIDSFLPVLKEAAVEVGMLVR
ncbi:IclR family transcriptional regulator C-terminal domain-containing protein [Bradyrhizobium sp. AUGA SZCCT0177]|uniref:IclR family transcriptional regulator domain-containing protein n=1 Tax=Bradyrhizobium sp. AUGA SZCCT0177 TaxID=2807665 RepID=UPI00201291F3|nr:IclR family transcriptional regulator C-terminal domain-containing protein [Bradyrhizobium sp. AUGA SZCCT0177]